MRRLPLFSAVTLVLMAAALIVVALIRSASAGAGLAPAHLAPTSERASARLAPTITTITTDTIPIPTYPYAAHLFTATNVLYNISYPVLNWSQYEGSHPHPVDKTYTRLILENDWLRVSVLPELGGRVYELIYKPTGNNELYRNPVVKPTNWGPNEQGWWLAAGGIEWCLPVEEHGYESARPWAYTIITATDGITVTVRDSTAPDRLRAAVSIFLPDDRAALFIRPRIDNDRDVDLNFKWWINAMLAPGPGNSVGKYANNANGTDLKFIFPESEVTVHSTGDPSLPGEHQPMAWPVYNSRDLSRLQNWRQWLGFFARPGASQDFVSVYDLAHREGIARIFPHTMATGSKGFGMGWRDPIGAAQWTDDDSYYVELHGGLASTFWDSASLAAHSAIEWEEVWYPFGGLTDLTAANQEAALHIEHTGTVLNIGLYSTRARTKPHLSVWQRSTCDRVADHEIVSIDPSSAQSLAIPTNIPLDDLAILFHADDHLFIGYNAKDCVPPWAYVDGLPHVTTSSVFTVTWTGSDLYSGIAAYDVQFKDGHEGMWTDWLTGTTVTSALFSGEHGHTYFFRARARDAQGNIGMFRGDSEGDTFTTVLLTPAPVLEFSYKSVPPFFNAGQPINYAIVLKNTGNLTGAITLTDTLPLSLTLISGTLTAESGSAAYDGSRILWSGTITPDWGTMIQYALTPTIDLGVMQPQTNAVIIYGGVVPITRTATTAMAINAYLPMVARNH